MTQEHHVFAGTVRDNLALANGHADDGRIHAALAAVDADTWVRQLPDGLDTIVGSGERTLNPRSTTGRAGSPGTGRPGRSRSRRGDIPA